MPAATSAPRLFRCVRALSGRAAGAALAVVLLSLGAAQAKAPEIRTSARNAVPACVTPQRLMAFLKTRNHNLDPRFKGIAAWYARHGERWHVRWDYAFFQMAVETYFLTFKGGNGRWGDVRPRQNNFAGLGTTGGGVPGDSYPDVGTGVLAQIQHLVVYSGERIAHPVGQRTRLKQDDILESMQRFNGHATFADLARRWAADRHYGAVIEWVAGKYRSIYCTRAMAMAAAKEKAAATALPRATALGGPGAASAAKPVPVRTIWSRATHEQRAAPAPAPVAAAPRVAAPPVPLPAEKRTQRRAPPKRIAVPTPVEVTPAAKPVADTARPAVAAEPLAFAFAAAMNALSKSAKPVPQADTAKRCRVHSASYGGKTTVLIRAQAGDEAHYTALTVLDGFEGSMLGNYLKTHAPGGTSLGTFASKDAALARARELCPGREAQPQLEGARAG